MKALWSGSLSFGLLNIPVHIYSAIAEHSFGFKLLCGTCHKNLKNLRWCDYCKKEVAWENTVKGFEKSKGSFVVMTQELIDRLKPEKVDVINIKEFVSQSDIEILYIRDHYYMLPSKKNDKAFYLFVAALKKSKKVAIGQFVFHEKEYVVAISFYKNMLLLNTLHYEHEIRSAELHETKAIQPTKQELSLALLLIEKGTRKQFLLNKYKNTFIEKLKNALKKAKTIKKTTKKRVTKEVKKSVKKESLVNSLKESLHEKRV